MTKYQVLRQIAEYRIACKQDGVSIEDRPSSHRLIQGWSAIWILINRIKSGYYDSMPRDPLTNAQLRDVYPEDYA